MPKIGPFFYIRGKLLFDAIPLEQGRKQFDKLDNPVGHDALYDAHFKGGDYIDYPRGRVVWDTSRQCAIVYIDPCIEKAGVMEKIVSAFELGTAYTVAHDDHYRCKRCVGRLWDEA